MNLCSQGHDDIAYEGSSDCPLCRTICGIEQLREFIESNIGPVKYDEKNGYTFPDEVEKP